MTKRSDGGVTALGRAIPKKLSVFVEEITKAEYKELSAEDKLEKVVENQIVFPEERTTVESAKQRQFVYRNSKKVHQYYAQVNTGILGEKFIDRGSPNVGVYSEKGERLFYQKFNKNLLVTLVFRIGAYAKLAKNIIDRAPKDAQLVVEEEVGLFWVYPDNKKIPFDYRNYLYDMSKEEIEFIKASQYRTNRWLEKSRPKVKAGLARRRKDILRINSYKKKPKS